MHPVVVGSVPQSCPTLQLHGLQHARLPCPVSEKPVSITLMHPGSNMHKLGFCLKWKGRTKPLSQKSNIWPLEPTRDQVIGLSRINHIVYWCFPSGGASGKESTCQCKKQGSNPWIRKIPWRRAWLPSPVFLPGESHGQRSLAGYSPRGRKESDTTEANERTHRSWLSFMESEIMSFRQQRKPLPPLRDKNHRPAFLLSPFSLRAGSVASDFSRLLGL